MFSYMWEFWVNPNKIDDFEQAYGTGGEWVTLFRKNPGYIKTELFRDLEQKNRYLTIDYWKDQKSFERFKQDFGEEFEHLDKFCETFTEKEKHLGNFETP